MRVLLAVVFAFAIAFGLGANWYKARADQQRNVERLVELGGMFETRQGSHAKVQVWYDGDLQWLEDEGRYEITLASSFNGYEGIAGWINDNLGHDFVESPTAIEIDCHDFGESTLTDEIVEQVRLLPTVKQVWIMEWTDGNGNCTNETTNDELAQLFPNLIVASPQQNRGITKR